MAADGATVPLWLALLTSVGSGALGAFATTWLTGRTDREERWRERLIAAAEDFQKPLLAANGAYQRAMHMAKAQDDALHDQWVQAVEVTNEARAKHGRLFLIFSTHSPVSMAGVTAIQALDAVDKEMKSPESFDRIDQALKYAVAQTGAFADVANEAI